MMKKDVAIKLLGGTVARAAAEMRVTRQAVHQWPDVLPQRIEDRVLACQARKLLPPAMLGQEPARKAPATTRRKSQDAVTP